MTRDPLDALPALLLELARRHALDRVALVALPCALVGATAAVLLARYAPHTPRALAFLALVPAGIPLLFARRRVHSAPLTLAMELDRRLDARAAVVTAAELALAKIAVPALITARVRDDARRALTGPHARDAMPPLAKRTSALLLAAISLLALALAAPIAPASARRPVVRRALARNADAADAARRAADALEVCAREDIPRARSLTLAARAARALARDLDVGVARDEALGRADDLSRAADEALAWVRDARHQAAIDRALSELGAPEAQPLREAVAQGDLARLDDAVRRLADRSDASSRRRAMEALERAAAAARGAGVDDLARSLDEEHDLLRRRGLSSELARTIAEAVGDTPGASRIADHLSRVDRDQELSLALDDVMRELERQLTPEQRRRIAQAMARMAMQADAGNRAAFDRAARATTPEEARAAMRALLEHLRDGSLDRTQGGRAARAGADARGDLARLRIGLQTGVTPGATGGGGSGVGLDEGHVSTTGETDALRRQGFTTLVRSAHDPRNPGVPVSVEHINTTGTQATTPDETRLRLMAPSALHGLERTQVPEPYRQQVRTYFGQ